MLTWLVSGEDLEKFDRDLAIEDLILRMFFLMRQYLTIKINVDEWSLYKGKSNDFETSQLVIYKKHYQEIYLKMSFYV